MEENHVFTEQEVSEHVTDDLLEQRFHEFWDNLRSELTPEELAALDEELQEDEDLYTRYFEDFKAGVKASLTGGDVESAMSQTQD